MANLFIDSFDHYATADGGLKYEHWEDSTVNVADGYLGTNCLGAAMAAYIRPRAVKRVVNSPADALVWGFRWKTGSSFPLSGFYVAYILTACHYSAGTFSNSTKQISINLTHEGRLEIRRGNWNGTLLATSTDIVLTGPDVWHYVEVRALIANSGGTVTVSVDDVVAVSYTGDTQYLASSNVNAAEFVGWSTDDAYINDTSGVAPHNGFYGSGFHVQVLRPAADDSVTWLPTSGDNYTNVDDTTPDGTSDVTTSGAGDQDTYQLETLVNPYRVLTLQANVWASGGGTLAPVVEIDAVTYDGDTSIVPGTPFDLRAIWPVNPASGLRWTTSTINAARWGFRRLS
ncbi:MAG TPA: hypothetical protein VFP09_02930 [Desertimonas sp.]|nr:hypothetical protein [Desertimonas sp.]